MGMLRNKNKEGGGTLKVWKKEEMWCWGKKMRDK